MFVGFPDVLSGRLHFPYLRFSHFVIREMVTPCIPLCVGEARASN